ncbi:MAG: hypothetical protein AAFZ09_04810, partial [Pseudomonadota bacterium]
MKSAITRLVLVALPSLALALPAEDHWSADTDPADAARLEESRLLIEAERYEDALAILEELAKAMPASADVFNLLGFAHRKTGNMAVSGAHYERALYLKPDHLGALEYQGELFLLLGDIAGHVKGRAVIHLDAGGDEIAVNRWEEIELHVAMGQQTHGQD